MFKKLTALLLLCIFCLCACSDEPPIINDGASSAPPSSSKPEEKPKTSINPLTGEEGLALGKEKDRPVAVMINNVSLAQTVQAGIAAADIVYETEVEGGITRLMAVYQDITKVPQIGSVRSARYPYVDLALGHDAIYVHCGEDPTYCKPHLKDINHISIDSNIKGAKRIPNGLKTEHTLYALGPDLWETLVSKFRSEKTDVRSWQTFAQDKNTIALADGVANKVTFSFTRICQSEFTFDPNTKTYIRSVEGETRTDYVTGETTQITNIFILDTTITNYSDGYHRKVALDGGEGYYITNGTYQKIKWSKGAAKNGFTFTDETGKSIRLNQGKSWVCIADKSRPEPTFQ